MVSAYSFNTELARDMLDMIKHPAFIFYIIINLYISLKNFERLIINIKCNNVTIHSVTVITVRNYSALQSQKAVSAYLYCIIRLNLT